MRRLQDNIKLDFREMGYGDMERIEPPEGKML
jgi:hypothetical protein